jgi:hypothetical protein
MRTTQAIRRASVAGALCALSVVAAAGPAAGARQLDPCGLLAKSEIVSAIREPLARVKSGPFLQGSRFCSWEGKDSKTLSRGITSFVATDQAAERYKQYVAVLKSPTPVSGIGIEAVSGEQNPSNGPVVVARSARSFLFVTTTYRGSGVTPATVKALAAKAFARLERRLIRRCLFLLPARMGCKPYLN